MTVRAPSDLQEILSLQAKNLGLARNALILQILWDWAERQGKPNVNRHFNEGQENVGIQQHQR